MGGGGCADARIGSISQGDDRSIDRSVSKRVVVFLAGICIISAESVEEIIHLLRVVFSQ